MKKCRKALSVLLSVCMLLSVTAGMSFNAYAKTKDGFVYEVYGKTATITGYKGKAKKVKIPAKIGKYSVKSIGYGAFFNCEKLTSITIPASVKDLFWTSSGYLIFSGCSSLKAVNVSKKNKTYCSVDGVLFNKKKTTIIYYPEAKKGKSYKIPKSVKTI